jgi:hypothetical protein
MDFLAGQFGPPFLVDYGKYDKTQYRKNNTI